MMLVVLVVVVIGGQVWRPGRIESLVHDLRKVLRVRRLERGGHRNARAHHGDGLLGGRKVRHG